MFDYVQNITSKLVPLNNEGSTMNFVRKSYLPKICSLHNQIRVFQKVNMGENIPATSHSSFVIVP